MSMLLDLSRFRGGVDQITRRFEASQFDTDDSDFRVISPVELDVEVQKDAKKVRLVGQVRTTLSVDCGRCLEPFSVPVVADFDSLFLPAVDNAGSGEKGEKGEKEVSKNDLGESFYENDAIDLGDVVREQFYLALPMKPLCQADCRGLCPVCGVNRNRESCTCQTEWVDPRMEALRRFTQ